MDETNGFAFDLILEKQRLTVSYDPGKEFIIYIDGEEIKFNDEVQYFRVWNRALTAEEMRELI